VVNRCGVLREDPVSTDARAKAHALAWLFAEKADFGISPAMIRVAHEMDAGLQRRLERDRINRTPPRSVSETHLLREMPSPLRRDDVGDRSLERPLRPLSPIGP